MIEFKNVSKEYQKGKKAVDGLNLQIKDGEIFGFLGQQNGVSLIQ